MYHAELTPCSTECIRILNQELLELKLTIDINRAFLLAGFFRINETEVTQNLNFKKNYYEKRIHAFKLDRTCICNHPTIVRAEAS